MLWSLLLWRYSRPTWTRSSTAYCRWPCFGRRVGLDDPQRSLATPTILWFCDSVTHFEIFRKTGSNKDPAVPNPFWRANIRHTPFPSTATCPPAPPYLFLQFRTRQPPLCLVVVFPRLGPLHDRDHLCPSRSYIANENFKRLNSLWSRRHLFVYLLVCRHRETMQYY